MESLEYHSILLLTFFFSSLTTLTNHSIRFIFGFDSSIWNCNLSVYLLSSEIPLIWPFQCILIFPIPSAKPNILTIGAVCSICLLFCPFLSFYFLFDFCLLFHFCFDIYFLSVDDVAWSMLRPPYTYTTFEYCVESNV